MYLSVYFLELPIPQYNINLLLHLRMPLTGTQSGGAPDPVRTIFLDDPSTDFRTSYEELSSLVPSYSATIASRWRKKAVALRSKCLAQAWASASPGQKIPDRRPRLSERLLGVNHMDFPHNLQENLPMEEFLFACINLEQLATNPATLLNLIYSRSVKHPSYFGRSDYTNFVDPVLKLFRPADDQNEASVNAAVVMIQNDESSYGVINMLSRQSGHYQQGIYRKLFCDVDSGGTWLMKWQKTIIDFCLYCVKAILSPGDLKNKPTGLPGAEKLLEGVQNFSTPSAVGSSRFAILLTLPYTIPKEFDFQDAHTRARAHLRFAEDHVGLLRTDPNYLLSEIELRLAHRAEHILDIAGRKGNAESSQSVGDTIVKVIHSSYVRLLVWNEICILFEEASQIMPTIQGSNPMLDEKIQMIQAVLCFCESFSKSGIAMNVCAGPQLRRHFFRPQTFTRKMAVAVLPGLTTSSIFKENPIDGLFMCIFLSGKVWHLDLNTTANEIEHIMTTDRPELKSRVHPWLMNILSDAAAVFDIQENLERHIPSMESPNFIKTTTDHVATFSKCINDFADMWPSVDLYRILGDGPMGWKRMLKVADGDGMKRFWAVVDEQVVRLSGGQTLDLWVMTASVRSATRRKGKWMWQGKVFLAEADRNAREEWMWQRKVFLAEEADRNAREEVGTKDEGSFGDEGSAADEDPEGYGEVGFWPYYH